MNIRFWSMLLVFGLGLLMVPEGQQAQLPQPRQREWKLQDPADNTFVIEATADGTACRLATREEAERYRAGRGQEGLRPLEGESGAIWRTQQTGLRITLRATTQLNNNAVARQAFLRAAAYWESIISSPIQVVIDVDFGPTRFGVAYPNQNVIGSTSGQTLGTTDLYPEFRNQLIAAADTPQKQQIFQLLPPGGLPTDLGVAQGVYTPSPVLRALGFLPSNADPTTEQSLYGAPPSVGFNSSFTFDFDPSDGIDFNKIDFNATAIHEIGHLLGFSSFVGEPERLADRSPQTDLSVNVWDFYRFRPGVTLAGFSSAPRVLLAGGDHLHFAGLSEAPLSTSRLDGQSGDGRQAPHWKDDVTSGQFIGIMDPTASFGLREEVSAKDLVTLGHFGYQISPSASVTERLVVDRNQGGTSFFGLGPMMVNRLSPTRYPATVRSVLVGLALATGQPSPAGAPIRVVLFRGGAGTGLPPSNPSLVFDRTFTIPQIPQPTSSSVRLVEFTMEGPTIDSGDLFVGVQATGSVLGLGVDTSLPDPQRSFISEDNGVTFRPMKSVIGGSGSASLLLRAVVSTPFRNQPVPMITQVSPEVLPVGGGGLTLSVLGQNFQPGSVVRWNGNDRPTTFLSSSLLEMTIAGSDLVASGTARVSVNTPAPGGGTSTEVSVTIGGGSPLPLITRLDPPAGMRNDPGMTVNVFGANLTPTSVARVNGNDRPTVFVSSRQVTTTLTAGDLMLASPLNVTVFNGGAGGGLSNIANFVIPVCNYAVSQVSQTFPSGAGAGSLILTTNNDACRWTTTANVPWARIVNPATAAGTGKYVVTYEVSPNTAAVARTGRLTLGGQIVVVRQAGLLSGVSAASYARGGTPDSIMAAFGEDLAVDPLVADRTPLPTNLGGTTVELRDSRGGPMRLAELFFVSPRQINFLLPASLPTGDVALSIRVQGTLIASGSITVTRVAPSLFSANASGQGVAAANLLRLRAGQTLYEPVATLNQTTRLFDPIPLQFGPASDRLFLVLYGTGVRGRNALSAVRVRIGDQLLTPTYAQEAPGFLGLDQVNVELPRSLEGRGLVDVQLEVEGILSNRIQLSFQ
jgi:uncharacterized protein (TIGR03437 family)